MIVGKDVVVVVVVVVVVLGMVGFGVDSIAVGLKLGGEEVELLYIGGVVGENGTGGVTFLDDTSSTAAITRSKHTTNCSRNYN